MRNAPDDLDSSLAVCKPTSLFPAHKAARDFYDVDSQAIQNRKYEALAEIYPMLCYCDPKGQVKPCWYRPDGHKGRLPFPAKILWAVPAFTWELMYWHKSVHQKKFYIDDSPHASLGWMTLFLIGAVLIDAFTDPKMAMVSDNCRSKYGRRRPFIGFVALYAPVVFLLSWTPVGRKKMASVWFGIFHIGVKIADTIFRIAHTAWGAQLTPISKERTNCWMWRDIFGNTGILFGAAVLPMLIHDGKQCASTRDDGCWQQPLISALGGSFFMFFCLLLAFQGREPTYAQLSVNKQKARRSGTWSVSEAASFGTPSAPAVGGCREVDTIPVLMATMLNRPFRVLLVTVFAKSAGTGVPFLMLPFIVPWVIGEKCFDESLYTILAAINVTSGIVMVLPWTWIAAKISKFRAYVLYNASVFFSSLLFLGARRDTGDCQASYMAIGLACFWGAAYSGSFLKDDMICDAIDYDEFLTGGLRREANYMMAVEFIPKFVTLPGECIPLIMMGLLKYRRPLPEDIRISCSEVNVTSGLTPDEFCATHYSSANGVCGNAEHPKTCAELLADGITFACKDAVGECGLVQNDSVVFLFRMCFSVIPAFFVGLGLLALCWYPTLARKEKMHEILVERITHLKRGETVEDPWRPGSFVVPMVSRGPHFGCLSYFWPSELCRVLAKSSHPDASDFSSLYVRPLVWTLAFLFLIFFGVLVVIWGYPDLDDEERGSVSPLGLMLIGVSVVGVWFQGTRARVARTLQKFAVPRQELMQYLNTVCPFDGRPRLSTDGEANGKSGNAGSPSSELPDHSKQCPFDNGNSDSFKTVPSAEVAAKIIDLDTDLKEPRVKENIAKPSELEASAPQPPSSSVVDFNGTPWSPLPKAKPLTTEETCVQIDPDLVFRDLSPSDVIAPSDIAAVKASRCACSMVMCRC